jgi:hypothetical protein
VPEGIAKYNRTKSVSTQEECIAAANARSRYTSKIGFMVEYSESMLKFAVPRSPLGIGPAAMS